jgi:hypothetical protein
VQTIGLVVAMQDYDGSQAGTTNISCDCTVMVRLI